MVNPVASAPVPRATAFHCPSCGASLELHAQGWAVTVVCGSCGAQLDAANEQLRVLQYGEKPRLSPRIPLGTRGTWKGVAWEAIGCQVVTITVEEVDYSWTEYVCFNPFRGFLYLSEYQGHWNVIEKLRRRPTQSSGGDQPTFTLDGRTYKHFQTAVARTTAALGEFPWELRVGDRVVSQDYVAAPYLLSAEASEGEITWSQGIYTRGDAIQKAFGLPREFMAPIGVFANQPNPYADLPKQLGKRFMLGVLALVVMLLLTITMASDRDVFSQTYTYDRSVGENGAFVTSAFTLEGRPSGVAIDLRADLANDWVFFTLSLINEQTGATREVTRQLEYYSGTDSDGSWSEGDRSETVRLSSVPAGRYFLRVQPEGGDVGRQSVNYTLRVRRDPPHYGFYGLAFLALVIPLVFALFPAAAFENRRWAESDHPIGGTTTTSDDE
ncbi:DUF4178 domain-containing protein [Gemmatimonas sp.]|jgi:hypothetical protein|uniref:DUF4178 domain-containing protein n=1 Tax=Gemmatimonas sp. TaxID=1962908 RepID=UPI0037BF0AEF